MASVEYDARKRCCAWYYDIGAFQKCANCQRTYCSRKCQINDWKTGRHKVWCGKAGEKGIDYDIFEAGGGKGLGVFTKRDFKRGEKIIVERPVLTHSHDDGFCTFMNNQSALEATLALAPYGMSTLMEKFMMNCAALGYEGEQAGHGLFVHFSRVNHDCIGNSAHWYDPQLGLMLLVANHNIPVGSEVTFRYTNNASAAERVKELANSWKFNCFCAACQNPILSAKLDRRRDLDQKLVELGCDGSSEDAIRAGMALIKIYDDLPE